MKAQKNTADELEAGRRAHAAEKQAAEELRQKIHEASLVRTPPQTPPREPSSDHASHTTAGRMRAAALKSLRTELEHARAALAEMRLRSDHTEESHVKALQHDLRHAAEECQELHDEVAKEKKLRAESEEALRMEQSVFAEAAEWTTFYPMDEHGCRWHVRGEEGDSTRRVHGSPAPQWVVAAEVEAVGADFE